jgi:hypothetical protein
MSYLVDRSGARPAAVYSLGVAATTIGRSGENHVVVPNERASRRHAQVTWDGTRYVLEDLGSRNGTFLNGRRLTAPQPLQHGDLITVADCTLFFDAADETLGEPEAAPAGGLRIDTVAARAWAGDQELPLTAKEYQALLVLHNKRGLVTKEELAQQVWPEYQGAVGDYNIEQLIARLRRKLEAAPGSAPRLRTVRGLGYRLETESE